ncbi:MAG: hypothetical protein QNJ03_02370 [Dinoroseobacter sp.]|nr:hypothetical protein [Dinoroseobacter sp.]
MAEAQSEQQAAASDLRLTGLNHDRFVAFHEAQADVSGITPECNWFNFKAIALGCRRGAAQNLPDICVEFFNACIARHISPCRRL